MSRSKRFKRVLRSIIAVVVVIGLVMATRSALQQWNAQKQIALDRLEELDESIRTHSELSSPQQPTLAELVSQREAASAQVPSLRNLKWGWIGLAGVLYTAGLLPGGWVLAESSRLLGYRVSIITATRAQIIGHLGKYVPGKAMVVVMRAGQLNTSGVPLRIGGTAVFIETLLMMAVGAALAGVLVFWLPVPSWIAWTSMSAGLAVSIPTLPPVLRRIMFRLQDKLPPKMANSQASVVRFFWAGWVGQLLTWLLIGGSFTCLIVSLPVPLLTDALATTIIAGVSAIALGMVVGFASLLPGGAGVRELTLTVILSPVVGVSGALLAAILARLLFIAVELAMAGICLLAGKSAEPGLRDRVSR